MVIMLMNSISFLRIITIASCAMFVSALFKLTEPKIVYIIEYRCQSIPLSNIYGVTVSYTCKASYYGCHTCDF